ncbi:MAG: class I SAM-dependent methyltransferase [Caldilineaceae bacterium]|nr:class I SAM-dependent methyltransferase [Caldilineaceae bacterium]
MSSQTDSIKSAVNQQFSQVAANYSTSAVHAAGADLQKMVELGRLTGVERVLDAGCGAGHTALAFAPFAREVMAVDLSEAMLGQCRTLAAARGITNADFRMGDVEQLDFGEGEFDLVVSRYSAHHWPHPQVAINEFARVLKPGGLLLLDDIVSYDSHMCDSYLQTIEVLRDPSHVRDHTPQQWCAMFAAAGLQADVPYEGGVWIDFASWVERMNTPATAVAAIQQLFGVAPAEVQQSLQIAPNGDFTFRGAIMRGAKA